MANSPRMQWIYPNEDEDPWFDRFVSMVLAMDASSFASREDRHIILARGGTVAWDHTTGLTWDDEIWLTAPITGFSWRLAANTTALPITEGQVLYTILNRGTLQNATVAPVVANTVPSTDDAIVLAIRIGTTLYWRNGDGLATGGSLSSGLGAGGGGGGGTLSGDVTGPLATTVVEALRGTAIQDPLSPTDGQALLWNNGASEWQAGDVSGGGLASIRFNLSGPLVSGSVPVDYVDGLHELGVSGQVSAVVVSQEGDGNGGSVTVELYKVDTVGAETQITVTNSASLSAGGGARARSVSTSFNGGTDTVAASDRLGIKITSVQTGPPYGVDLSVTVLLSGASLVPAPGLPEDDEVTQALLRTVVGTTFENIGTVYLPAGTILAADSRVFMGVDNAINNAELEIRDAITSALITTISATGLPADTQPGGDIAIPSDAWYSLRLRADTVAVQATIFGLKFVYSAGQGTRIRQAIDAEVTGTTFENVGAVYLPAGTLQAPGRIFAGATTAGPDAAEVELRRETGGTLITTWTATGTLQEATVAAVTIPAADWYNIRLRGSAGGVVALLKGIDWTVLT